jgi:ribosomal protein L1
VTGPGEGGSENPMSQMIDSINKEYSIKEIFSAVKQTSKERKFPESLELILQLNVDPT